MSYIGKNPEADSIKLKGSATEPSGTSVDGQVYFNTGTGSISKGMKVYKNSQFVAIDKQLGDAETMQLLKAADIPAIDFSLSVTSTTVGGNNAVPFESSTGDFDGTAAFSNSSTGDALLTDDSADLVFHYTTQATNNADNDFWGIPFTVPRAFRGGNLVLEFKYRTEIATGTMDNGYFNIAIQDRSAMILQTQDSTISAGAIAAGSNVLLDGKTYANPVTGTTLTVAVGDRVFVESGTGTAGSQDNDIVDCYITSVSSTDNNVTLSKDIVAVQDGKFVTGWLTGYDTGGQIAAFASDTNKDGTTKKLAFKTDADTQQISLWFFVKGTSTVKHELFFDNILLSGNKFLQASSQLPQIVYAADQPATNSYADNTGMLGLGTALMTGGTMEFGSQQEFDSYMTISGSPTKFEVHKDCEIHFYFSGHTSTPNRFLSLYKNTTTISADGYFVGGANVGADGSSTSFGMIDTTFKFKAGDYFALAIGDMGGGSTATMSSTAQRTQLRIGIKPVQSDVILLESQDEIFTDWNEYSITAMKRTGADATHNGTFGGTVNLNKAYWRRVGGDMEIKWNFRQTATGTAGTDGVYVVPLPDGYSIDLTKVGNTDYAATGYAGVPVGVGKLSDVVATLTPTTMPAFPSVTEGVSWGLTIQFQGVSGGSADDLFAMWSDGDLGLNTQNLSLSIVAKVPIAGWNSNFNPLLSMPLVEIGTDFGYFNGYLNGGVGPGSSYRKYIDTTYIDTLSTSGLGTLTKGSSTAAFNFQASVNCIVTVNYTFGASTGIQMGPVFGAASAVTDSTKAMNTSDMDGLRAAVVEQPASSGQGQNSARFPLKAGENFQMAQSTTGTAFSGGINSLFSIMVERDRGNTNMAHIIKPAVAILRDIKGVGVVGGEVTDAMDDSVQKRDLNTIYGESWFVTLSANVFTLEPGTYKFTCRAPWYQTTYTSMGLYDVTNSAWVPAARNSGFFSSSSNQSNALAFDAQVTITSSTQFQLGYTVNSGHGHSTWNMGVGQTFTAAEAISVFAEVVIEKLK